ATPYCFFFFSSRRRHTRSDRDWSSDMCSSDLAWIADLTPARAEALLRSVLAAAVAPAGIAHRARSLLGEALAWQARWREALSAQIGRASCRERVYMSGGGGLSCRRRCASRRRI